MISDLPSMKASVATFASSCANQLRGQNSGCKSVTVFIGSNRFREDLPQYGNAATVTLIAHSSDTLEITNAALRALSCIYVPGIMYKRSGVVVSDRTPISPFQTDLFDPVQNREGRAMLMKAIDNINHRYGLKTIQLCVAGGEKEPWKLKSEHRSPNYLTDINDILTVKA